MCYCVVCKKQFKTGDMLQAFLRCPDDPDGSWTTPTEVDDEFQNRSKRNADKIKRKHEECQPMDYLKLLNQSYKFYNDDMRSQNGGDITRLAYLSESVFDFCLYDSDADTLFGAKALEVCVAITFSKTFDYQDIPGNYEWYLIMCNMPFFGKRLNWGTSVRAAWWDHTSDDVFSIDRSGGFFDENGGQIQTPIKLNRDQWIEFVKAMIIFTTEKETK